MLLLECQKGVGVALERLWLCIRFYPFLISDFARAVKTFLHLSNGPVSCIPFYFVK